MIVLILLCAQESLDNKGDVMQTSRELKKMVGEWRSSMSLLHRLRVSEGLWVGGLWEGNRLERLIRASLV